MTPARPTACAARDHVGSDARYVRTRQRRPQDDGSGSDPQRLAPDMTVGITRSVRAQSRRDLRTRRLRRASEPRCEITPPLGADMIGSGRDGPEDMGHTKALFRAGRAMVDISHRAGKGASARAASKSSIVAPAPYDLASPAPAGPRIDIATFWASIWMKMPSRSESVKADL